jgi:hypothetical protein
VKRIYELSPHGPDLAQAVADLDGYAKAESISHLMMESIPTLEGLVLTAWDEGVERSVETYLTKRRWFGALLRHDRCPEVPPYPEGGYIVSSADISTAVQPYLADRRIVLLLEPYSSLDNGYNVSLLFNPDDTIILEVAGPGFDASDLQRGHISPHEILQTDGRSLRVWKSRRDVGELRSCFQTLKVTDEVSYKQSVTERLEKIARKLINSGEDTPFDRKHPKFPTSVSAVESYLLRKGFGVLAQHKDEYAPIPNAVLEQLLPWILKIPSHLSRRWGYEMPFVVASSFVSQGSRLVFWDVVRPTLKYRMSTIYQ